MYVSVYGHVHVSAGVIPVPKRAQDFPGIGVIGCCEVLYKRGVCSELPGATSSLFLIILVFLLQCQGWTLVPCVCCGLPCQAWGFLQC